jgi:hypothetical protein
MEEKVIDISHNMSLLMEALSINIGPFEEDGGSNSYIRSKWKLGENEELEKDLRKEPKKEKPSSSSINP